MFSAIREAKHEFHAVLFQLAGPRLSDCEQIVDNEVLW